MDRDDSSSASPDDGTPPGKTAWTSDSELIESELRAIDRAIPDDAEKPDHIRTLIDRIARSDAGGSDQQPYLIGLAFSGGGIRSATFSLGVMQRLAKAHILKHVDYLSTVSGGGYIGSALSWWLSGRSGAPTSFDADEHLPFGTRDPKTPSTPKSPGDKDEAILDYLRVHGNYLTPGNGITIWSGIAITIRTLLLNLLVWLPVAAFIFWLLRLIGTLPFMNGLPHMVSSMLPGALAQLVEAVGGTGSVSTIGILPPTFLLALILAVISLVLFLFAVINYSLLSWVAHTDPQGHERMEPISKPGLPRWLVSMLIGAVGLFILVFVIDEIRILSPDLFGVDPPEPRPGILIERWPLFIGVALIVAWIFVAVDSDTESSPWKTWFRPMRRPLELLQALRFKGVAYVFLVLLFFDWLLAPYAAKDLALWPEWYMAWPDWFATPTRVALIAAFLAWIGILGFANFWTGFFARLVLRTKGISVTYGARRLFEAYFGLSLKTAFLLLVVGTIPLVHAYLKGLGGIEGVISLVIGAGSMVAGRLRRFGNNDGQSTPLVFVVASFALTYGVLLIGYRWSVLFAEGDVTVRSVIAVSVILAFLVGIYTNINYIGFHRFYRDRLMEAFMPDWETTQNGLSQPATHADGLRLSSLWPGEDHDRANRRIPFHIINTNVVLPNSSERRYRLRGGDNFILTPLACGSDATGWVSTKRFIENGMTLATAMAISGAAANPRTGAGGKGVTRNKFVSIGMGLLGIRLGYWVHNPRSYLSGGRWLRRFTFNQFFPAGWYAFSPKGYREDSAYLELSDGGHFENLAIYELVRRQCGLIILCDGGQDNETSYADFVSAIQRLGQDMNAAIRFDMSVTDSDGETWKPSDPAQLIARPDEAHYPKAADYSEKGYFVATIDYGEHAQEGWPKEATIIYLKSSMIRELDMVAKGYKGAHPSFPNQTTADQFFDEEQFEAYREVGYRVAEQMLTDLDLPALFAASRPSLAMLRSNDRFRRSETTSPSN